MTVNIYLMSSNLAYTVEKGQWLFSFGFLRLWCPEFGKLDPI